MTTPERKETQPVYWFVVSALFLIVGIVLLLTAGSPWLGAIACAVGVLWAVLGLLAMRRR